MKLSTRRLCMIVILHAHDSSDKPHFVKLKWFITDFKSIKPNFYLENFFDNISIIIIEIFFLILQFL